MKMKKGIRAGLTVLTLLILLMLLFLLNHTAKIGTEEKSYLPPIADTPLYVEGADQEITEISLLPEQNVEISSMKLIVVNLAEDGEGSILFTVKRQGEVLSEASLQESEVQVGEWVIVPVSFSMLAGETYTISILPQNCSPYFMKCDLDEIKRSMAVSEDVFQNGSKEKTGISLGYTVSKTKNITFGDIFYCSRELSILLAVIILLLIWLGTDGIARTLQKLKLSAFFERFGSDLFLILLFGVICLVIYDQGVAKSIYITSDSDGYLREAVALSSGHGFSFDGAAGYRSWFSNWPILYPLMIAAVMLLSGMDAYLSSKLVSVILVAFILIVLRIYYKRKAFAYAFALTSIGFLQLTYYTWSELPFILFLLLFGLQLSEVLQKETNSLFSFCVIGLLELATFLTRYFGIYVYGIAGAYGGLFLLRYYRKKQKADLKKSIGLLAASFVSGMLSACYLLMNKIMSGMASGVSRTMWWDDYETLTQDLVNSLLTEFFHSFHLEIPEFLSAAPYPFKAFVLLAFLAGFLLLFFGFASQKNQENGKWTWLYRRETVFVLMAALYNGMFIVIRYFSSMDTFYFRFFAPSTFLLTIGMIEIILPDLEKKKGFYYLTGMVTLLLVISAGTILSTQKENQDEYYQVLRRQWVKAYAEIPQRSVIIFNNIDFRSTWTREDVISGMIYEADTMDSLAETYSGSEYLCIRKEDVEVMLTEGNYQKDVKAALSEGLQALPDGREYVVIKNEIHN